ncbi:MAG TPA: MATE family efflux transporter [Vicinamibacterales bacterium]|nr:MATE family efflux transporter [Vicinamibacterales bacterium]
MIRGEIKPTLRLALPVILAELGWMFMGVVDTIMVGPLGPAAIAATGVGNSLNMGFAIFGMGLLLGLDTVVSQAYGAGDLARCRAWLAIGVRLAWLMTPPLMLVLVGVWLAIPVLGFHGDTLPLLSSYFAILVLSTPFLFLYAAYRRYLQSTHHVAPVMWALVTANIVNAVANWVFIYGRLGLPALGVTGAAWATFSSRLYMCGLLGAVVWWSNRTAGAAADATGRSGIADAAPSMRRLLQLGLPAASTVTAEVGVFAVATALAGTLDPVATASHQIALNIAAVAFMIPLGLASAGAVRVGHAVGAGNPRGAAAAGWTVIAMGVTFMSVSGLLFVLVPRALIGLFSKDPAVLALGGSLLLIAAVFQLFDGLQGVVTGTLRGLGDTRTSMITNLAAHWAVGIPVGYTLCFTLGWGASGLWWGLSVGLIMAGIVLTTMWARRVRHYQERGYL